jgi:class 3 adenylate cyclase
VISSRSLNNNKLEMFCVFYVDMESSTYNTACLRPEDYSVYYAAFYDTLSDIARKFGGRVIKHVGDALLIYFPATSDPTNVVAFKSALDCGLAMLEAQSPLNCAFKEENLPSVCYRISADYGRMERIETRSSPTLDWIGPSMNMVAKMNRLARTNTMVVGGDLHQILSKLSLQEYVFDFAGELSIGIKQKYSVYSISRRDSSDINSDQKMNDATSAIVRITRNGKPEPAVTVGGFPNIVIVHD